MLKHNFDISIRREGKDAVTVRLYGTNGGNYKISDVAFFNEAGKRVELRKDGYPYHMILPVMWQGTDYSEKTFAIPANFDRKLKLHITDRGTHAEWNVCIDLETNAVEWM